MAGLSTLASADDDVATPAPSPTESHLSQPQNLPRLPHAPAFNPDGDADSVRASELEARYGHDRDIATPPLIVKQSVHGGSYVTKPLPMPKRIGPGGSSASAFSTQQPVASMADKPIKVASNQSMVASIKTASYQTPAAQFLNSVYLIMVALAVAVVALAIGLGFRKGKLKQ